MDEITLAIQCATAPGREDGGSMALEIRADLLSPEGHQCSSAPL